MFYLLKWKDFSKPSWEPQENLDCSDLLSDFESSRALKIIGKLLRYFFVTFHDNSYNCIMCIYQTTGAKKNEDGTIEYLVQYKDAHEAESVGLNKVKKFWPQLLIQFFENKILWKRAVQFNQNDEIFEYNENDNIQRAAGNPIENGNNQLVAGDPVEIKCEYFYYYLLCS